MKYFTVWQKKTFCLVTGASKGLGRQIAISFSKNVADGSVFLLLARSQSGLDETKSLIQSVNKNILVVVESVDLTEPDPELLKEIILKSLENTSTKPEDFDNAMIVHNVGSLGNITHTVMQQDDKLGLQSYYNLNLVSMITLNAKFLNIFPPNESQQRVVINITSLAAKKPFVGWTQYCSAKAARDAIMKVLAIEEPDLRVLSYSPGPLDTDMSSSIKNLALAKTKSLFKDITPLKCEETVKKLTMLLENNTFKSGAHIDFYDI